MIAAGSLFTSCVENTEPQGIRDLREAKADYLASLSKLREADAEKVKAEAAVEQAKAAVAQAIANLAQVAVEAAKIAVDLEDAAVQAKIAEIKAQAEYDAVIAEQNLATAEENLRAYLVKVEEQSKQLTPTEYQIVVAYTTAYNNVVDKQKAVRDKEKALYEATYSEKGEQNVEAAKAGYEQEKALAEQSKAYWEAVLATYEELSDAEIADYGEWVKKYDALQAENLGFKYDKAQIAKDSALNEYENKAVLDSFYDAIKAKQTAITKATKSFKLEFTGDKALALPELKVKGTNVVENFADAVNDIKVSAGWIHVSQKEKIDTLGIKFGSADKKVAEAAVDTLNIIIDALKREQVVVDQLVKDTAGIAALVVDTKHVYDSIKTALEAGIAKFGVIAEKQKAYETAKKAREDKEAKYTEDTTKLFAAIDKFLKDWNAIATTGDGTLVSDRRYNDSLDIFNDLKEIMIQRKNMFGKDTKYFFYTYDRRGQRVQDSVELSQIVYKDLQEGVYSFPHLLDAAFVPQGHYFTQARIMDITPGTKTTKIGEIDINEFKGADVTNYFENTFFNTYWVDVDHKNEIYVTRAGKYADVYVKAEKDAEDEAHDAITEAKQEFYKGIYCKFWGIEYDAAFKAKLNENQTAFKDPATDSLKIVYTEKTFTEPTVLAKFVGETDFFTPAIDKAPAKINFGKVTLKASKALDVIEKQLGKNYLKPEGGFTLYAQYLATAQFASDAKNYKENTAALKELETVVATVKAAYDAAVAATESGSALADSLKVKYLGKDKKYYGDADYTVNYSSKNITKFISKDGKGTFKLAGEQKELAEKWLADYAKTYSELEAEKAEIDVTISDNDELATIFENYIKKLAVLDGYTGATPDAILTSVKTYWTGVLNVFKTNINTEKDNIKKAEAKLAKLEAGYDQKQIDIEAAEDALAKAQQALEQAELEFAVAEEAYKAVLAAHGITE